MSISILSLLSTVSLYYSSSVSFHLTSSHSPQFLTMNRSHRSKPDWSTLPDHLLAVIAQRLQSLGDILRFRLVCKTFRSSLPPPVKTLIPPSARRTSFPLYWNPSRRNHFLLTESTIYAIEPLYEISNAHESTPTWVVRIEEASAGHVRIMDPLNGFRFRKLSKELPKSMNLLEYRVTEITKVYQLELATICRGKSRVYLNQMYKREPTFFVKVVASMGLDEFVVMAIHCSGRLFVWKDGDKKLTKLNIAHNDFLDIVYHDKKFYALRYGGLTIAVDSASFNITHVVEPPEDWKNGVNCLVKSFEDLFLVFQYWTCGDTQEHFKVFKLDEERHEWFPVVGGLDNRALFLGDDCSFSVSADEFSGCKGNCVYFNNISVDDDHPGLNTNIFHLKDNTVYWLSDFPGYSNIFWPPPPWLKHHASSGASSSSTS